MSAQRGQAASIDDLAHHLNGSYELCAKSQEASQNTVKRPFLNLEQRAVVAELGQILDLTDLSLERWRAMVRAAPPSKPASSSAITSSGAQQDAAANSSSRPATPGASGSNTPPQVNDDGNK